MVNHRSTPPSDRSPAQAPGAPHTATDGAVFTAREQELLPLLEADKTNSEIADALGISVDTVRTHIKHIRRKLGMGHREWAHLLKPKQGDYAPKKAPQKSPFG